MSTMTKNKPVKTLRDGPLKAAIWRNNGKRGVFYSVTLTRIYKRSDGSFDESTSFTAGELFKLARLAERTESLVLNLRDLGEGILS